MRAVLLVETGSHAVTGLRLSGYAVSEVHGAHQLLEEVADRTLVMVDAGIMSGGFCEHARERRTPVLGALQAGSWEHLPRQRRLADGSMLAWVPASRAVQYPMRQGMGVRIISYRLTDERLGEVGKVYRLVTTLLNPRVAPALSLGGLYHERWEIEVALDEFKTHERVQRKVLRSKTPEGVVQERYGIFLAPYPVRVMLVQAAAQAELDPARLSFTDGLFHRCEMISQTLLLEPEASERGRQRLRSRMLQTILPARQLRINRREVKQVYNKYKPKKRDVLTPEPFKPHEQFLDFVKLFEPLTDEKGA
ncbi:MAG: transposase [Chloroflexota bacterium]|nr:transposase [Chloroflexota bacterium]